MKIKKRRELGLFSVWTEHEEDKQAERRRTFQVYYPYIWVVKGMYNTSFRVSFDTAFTITWSKYRFEIGIVIVGFGFGISVPKFKSAPSYW